jgi:hypothetical protein
MTTVHTLPVLAVFDLDACLWDQEMFEMTEMPSDPVQGDLRAAGVGIVGVKCGRRIIRLHPGALLALQVWKNSINILTSALRNVGIGNVRRHIPVDRQNDNIVVQLNVNSRPSTFLGSKDPQGSMPLALV